MACALPAVNDAAPKREASSKASACRLVTAEGCAAGSFTEPPAHCGRMFTFLETVIRNILCGASPKDPSRETIPKNRHSALNMIATHSIGLNGGYLLDMHCHSLLGCACLHWRVCNFPGNGHGP